MTVSAADSQKQRGQTAYRVLKFPGPTVANQTLSQPKGIEDIGVVKAANPKAAIQAVAEKNGNGTYVAVPESSWKPLPATVTQETIVKVGDVT